MPSISSCPACHRDLTIPDLTDCQKSLRCPLCDAQFAAEQVLADCVAFPPLAIVVEAEEPGGAASEPERPQYSPADDEPLAAAATWRQSAAVADDSIASSPTSANRPDLPPGEPRRGDKTDELDDDGARYGEFEPELSGMRVAPRVRSKTSPLAAVGQIAGIGVGGVLGLAIGYWVLLWLGGAQADFLQLRGKLPRWLVPPARRHHATLQAPLAKQKPEHSAPDRSLIDMAGPALAIDGPADGPAVDDGNGMPLQPLATDAASNEIVPVEPVSGLIDAPDLAANALPDGYVGPRDFKLRTAADLRTAIEQTEFALRCPRCQMPGAVRLVSFDSAADGLGARAAAPPCDACRGKPVIHLGAAGFAQLCALGEAVTFVQLGADDERADARDAAEAILMAIGSQRDKRETIGRLAGAWLADSARPTDGIAIAGTVEDARQQGDLFRVRLMLLGCGKHVEVVSREAPQPALAQRDHVVMLGSIVDSPSDNLVGYAGEAPQVIWGGLHLKVTQ